MKDLFKKPEYKFMNFNKFAVLLSASLFACGSYAGPYQEKLNKCLIAATTDQDRQDLVEWMFFGMAKYPTMSKYTTISNADLERSDKKVSKIFENILITKCNREIKDVVSHEGTNALSNSFEYLGKTASNALIVDPKVSERLMGFVKFLDEKTLNSSFE